METACKRYVEGKRFTELENLVAITKDVFDIDRHMMYDYLLTAHVQSGDASKALNLWTQMQEEDIQPKIEFLRKLAIFLKQKGQLVPFAVPADTEKDIEIFTPPQPERSTGKAAAALKPQNVETVASSDPKSNPPKTKEANRSPAIPSPVSAKIKEFNDAINNGDVEAAQTLLKEYVFLLVYYFHVLKLINIFFPQS